MMNFQTGYMNLDLMDEIANTQREYVKARLMAEKTRDPRLKKKSDGLFRKLLKCQIISNTK